MKLRRLAGLAALLPIALLSACSSVSPLTINANWYHDTTTRGILPGTYERLEYDVSFKQGDTDLKASYQNGTYAVELKGETGFFYGENLALYHLHTEFSADVSFSMDGKGSTDTFTDSVVTDVWFRDVNGGLAPVKSTRTVISTTPLSDHPENLNKDVAYRIYEYSTTTEYDAALEEAKLTYDEVRPEPEARDSEKKIDIGGKGTYLDNEEIAFALRGLDMSSAFTFRTINPVKRVVEKIGADATPEEVSQPVNFTLAKVGSSEEPEVINKSIDAFSVGVEYKGANPGYTQTLVYARKTNASNNQYRNFLLEMRVPLLNGIGTLTYTLKSATISEN